MSGDQCCANPPKLNPSCGIGHVEKFDSLDSYVTGRSDSRNAILLVSDVYGYEAPNLRLLADKVAADGFFVVVPDFFQGDPYVQNVPGRSLTEWIVDHGVDGGAKAGKSVVKAMKHRGFGAIGAAGFCWGAKVVVELAKQAGFIQAAVLLHPTFVTVDDIKGVSCPIAVLGAEFDKISPPDLVKQFESALSNSTIERMVKIFPGVNHGWTVRYDAQKSAEVARAKEAHDDMSQWFIRHVKDVNRPPASL